jgi:predicted nucleotidyltransferase
MNNTSTKKYLLGLIDEAGKSESDLLENYVEEEEDNFPSYLENKTAIIIQKEISDVCIRENIPQNILEKLTEYRYVDKICDLLRGKYVRWVRLLNKGDLNLTKGGIVADIKFLENGIYILIKNAHNQFIQYKFDDCITFQKLSTEELLYISIC